MELVERRRKTYQFIMKLPTINNDGVVSPLRRIRKSVQNLEKMSIDTTSRKPMHLPPSISTSGFLSRDISQEGAQNK